MSRPTDFCGCPVTLAAGPAVVAWDETQRAFLAHGARTPNLLAETLRLAPHFALAHAARGIFCLLLGRAEMVATAREALADACVAVAATHPTLRERAYVAALADWLDGRPSAAVAQLESALAAEPRDALAMKLVQAILFMLGRTAEMRRSVERLLPVWIEHPARGYLVGCHAFTLCETGDYSQAEAAGALALALAPDDAWGLHAVAHVHDMTGHARSGLAWLAARRVAWEHCNNFRFHVWWHVALMHLDLGDTDAAMALYDDEIRAERTDDYRDVANATSLLSRLEIEGVDVGDRWEELAVIADARTGDGCVVFADLHYLLALIGGSRDAAVATLLARMARSARSRATEMEAVASSPGLGVAEGLASLAEGNHQLAFTRLRAARGELIRIGGSHAQRDVFERLTVEAALRAGALAEAAALLDDRVRSRGAEDNYTARRRAVVAERARKAAAA